MENYSYQKNLNYLIQVEWYLVECFVKNNILIVLNCFKSKKTLISIRGDWYLLFFFLYECVSMKCIMQIIGSTANCIRGYNNLIVRQLLATE